MKKRPYPTKGNLYLRGSTYHYSFSFDGTQYRGSTGHRVKHKAQAVLDQERERYIRFVDPPDPRDCTIEAVLDLAEEHVNENVRSGSERTYKFKLINLREHLPLNLAAVMITNRVMRDYFIERRRTNPELSNHTLNQEISILKIGLKMAYKERLIPSMPLLDRLPAPDPRTGYFTEQEMFRLVEHVPEWMVNLVKFGFYSGMRKNEIISLEWRWLNTTNKTGNWRLDIPSHATKTHRARSLYLIDVLLQPIEDQIGGNPRYIFYNPRTFKDGKITDLKRHWNKACEKINKKGHRFHDLRRSAVRYWRLDRGLTESEVMMITGHRSRKVFDQFYNLVEAEDLLKVIENSANTKLSQRPDNVIDISNKIK